MKLTFFHNACQIIESNGFRLLCDPWLTEGAFEGAWFSWPPIVTKPDDVKDVDALYISHVHPDHYCVETLKVFRRDIPIVVLDHGGNYLHRLLQAQGFTNLVKIKDGQTIHFGPFRLTMFKPWCLNPWAKTELGNLIDSCLVIEADGQKILNTNDCTPTLEACFTLKERFGQFDITQLQFNSAGPFPACFDNLTQEEKLSAAQGQIQKNLDYMYKMALILQPKWVQPFAGAYVIGGKNWELNRYLGTTTAQHAQQHLLQRNIPCFTLAEGRTVDVGNDADIWRSGICAHSDEEMWEYIESLQGKKYSYENDLEPDPDEIQGLMEEAHCHLRNVQAQRNAWPNCNVSINGYEFGMSKSEYAHTIDGVTPWLRVTMDPRLLLRILYREAHWNNAEIGCVLHFNRVGPYMPDVHTLLSFFHV